jgi:predicted phage terminase large subunit-like protein
LEAIRFERSTRQQRRERARTEARKEEIRAKCGSLYGFIEEFWSILEPVHPFVGGLAIKAVCDHLEAVTRGDIQYLLITIPPGMMKSLAVAVFWPAWEWGPMGLASMRYLTSSFSEANVIRDNLKMRRLVESDKYQALWGDRIRFSRDQNAKTKFENTATGGREGRAFASMTGGRGDRVIIDDPHSVDTAESDVERASTVTTFREAIPDRLNDMRRSAIVVIMQRLHEDDVAGTIIKLGFPYVHLNLPMEFERYRRLADGSLVEVEPCRTYRKDGTLLFEDWRTEDGELLFPERFPIEVVGRTADEGLKKIKGPYAYAGQYQQRPTARAGGLFKREWFAGKIIPRSAVPPQLHRRTRAWDFAATEVTPGKTPDATAGVRMARFGSDYYIEHVYRVQTTPGKVRAAVVSFAETDPIGTLVHIPQDPAQAGVDQVEAYVKALAGHTMKAKRPTGSKTVRASPLATQVEFGHVYLVNSGEIVDGLDPWIEPFLDELCTFPMGSLDDQVDAAADAFNDLSPGSSKPFEGESAGRRDIVQEVERDSRYRFEDNDDDDEPGRGYGSGNALDLRI